MMVIIIHQEIALKIFKMVKFLETNYPYTVYFDVCRWSISLTRFLYKIILLDRIFNSILCFSMPNGLLPRGKLNIYYGYAQFVLLRS